MTTVCRFLCSFSWSRCIHGTHRRWGAPQTRAANRPIKESWLLTSWLRPRTRSTSRTFTASSQYAKPHTHTRRKTMPLQNEWRSVCFLQRTLQVLLPYLAAKASPTGSALIRTLAIELKANRREILINNFKYIFSHLVCSCTKEELERAFHYLQVVHSSSTMSNVTNVVQIRFLYLDLLYSIEDSFFCQFC